MTDTVGEEETREESYIKETKVLAYPTGRVSRISKLPGQEKIVRMDNQM